MALVHPYADVAANAAASLAAVKARLDITAGDTADDTKLDNVIGAVSRKIDDITGRRFWQASETRYFKAKYADLLKVFDFTAISSLQTDDDGDGVYENTWGVGDYYFLPENAALDLEPYTKIEANPNGLYMFPRGVRKGVKLTATFGYWAAVPEMIVEGCILQSMRIFKRKDAIYGVQSATDFGTINLQMVKIDDDVMAMVLPFVREVGISS